MCLTQSSPNFLSVIIIQITLLFEWLLPMFFNLVIKPTELEGERKCHCKQKTVHDLFVSTANKTFLRCTVYRNSF